MRKTYFAKGEEVVARNIAGAIRAGFENVREAPVPERWKTLDNDRTRPARRRARRGDPSA